MVGSAKINRFFPGTGPYDAYPDFPQHLLDELETGIIIQVPLFINKEDVIKVDTRNGSYLERVS